MLHGRLQVVLDDRFSRRIHRSLGKAARGVIGVVGVIDATNCMSRYRHYRVGDAVMDLESPGLGVDDNNAVDARRSDPGPRE